jgi:hypothetical protein
MISAVSASEDNGPVAMIVIWSSRIVVTAWFVLDVLRDQRCKLLSIDGERRSRRNARLRGGGHNE